MNEPLSLDMLQKNLKFIIKLQALFRGHMARKHTAFIMNSRRVTMEWA